MERRDRDAYGYYGRNLDEEGEDAETTPHDPANPTPLGAPAAQEQSR
jgi:hypothetical protein